MSGILTEGDAMLADILANPQDDATRLIYADWLADSDQPLRAEFIRVQVELAQREADGRDWSECSWGGTCCCRSHVLWRRHGGLLTPGHFWDWFGSDAGGWLRAWPGSPAVRINRNDCTVAYFITRLDTAHEPWVFTLSRGFISHIKLPQQAWLDHGREIVRRQPVQRVELSDKTPWKGNSSWHWWEDERELNDRRNETDDLHISIFIRLSSGELIANDVPKYRIYNSIEAATADLFQACLAYAKEPTT